MGQQVVYRGWPNGPLARFIRLLWLLDENQPATAEALSRPESHRYLPVQGFKYRGLKS